MKISIIIPVFNAGNFLTEAIDSIINNESADCELETLLIDDCSTDQITLDLLDKYSKISGIRVLRQVKNGGPAIARNTGIKAATGEWIAFLDADDLLAPGTIELRVKTIKDLPQIKWMAGDLLEITRKDELTHTKLYSGITNGSKEVAPGIFQLINATAKLVGGFPPLLGSMMIHHTLFDQTGLLDEKLIYGEDFVFTLIASCHTDLYWITTPCLHLRRYHESLTKNHLRAAHEAYKADLVALREPRLREVRKELRWHISGVLRVASQVFIKHRQRRNAVIAALKAIYWSPTDARNFSMLSSSILLTPTQKILALMRDAIPSQQENAPSVCVVVLNWNGLDDTLECLDSLLKSTYSRYDVLVVDNGSTDESANTIPSRYPSISFLPTGENLGWAGGNNVGIKEALAAQYDYIFLLNNDTVVQPDCITLLVKAAEQIGPSLLHPAIYYFDEPAVAQLDPTFSKPDACKDQPIQLDHAYGAALFIHGSVFEKIGLMDERFFLQLEETDFFLRAKAADIGSYCQPNARILHKESRSFGGRVTPMKTYYIVRNSLLILDKHSKSIPELAISLKRLSWTINRIISRARGLDNRWRMTDIFWAFSNNADAKAIRTGIIDFFLRKFGKSKTNFNH